MKITIRIAIADGHALFRGGLKSPLRRQRYMQVVGEANTAAAVMATVAETRCNILLLDVQMERWALGDIQQLAAVTKVIILTASENVENAIAAPRLGARAIVQKRLAVQTLVEAITLHQAIRPLLWSRSRMRPNCRLRTDNINLDSKQGRRNF
jgi:DNA-binding NarL/FixJ family response regulator